MIKIDIYKHLHYLSNVCEHILYTHDLYKIIEPDMGQEFKFKGQVTIVYHRCNRILFLSIYSLISQHNWITSTQTRCFLLLIKSIGSGKKTLLINEMCNVVVLENPSVLSLSYSLFSQCQPFPLVQASLGKWTMTPPIHRVWKESLIGPWKEEWWDAWPNRMLERLLNEKLVLWILIYATKKAYVRDGKISFLEIVQYEDPVQVHALRTHHWDHWTIIVGFIFWLNW